MSAPASVDLPSPWLGSEPEVDLGPVAELVVAEHRAAPAAVVGAVRLVGARWLLGLGAAGRLWVDPAAPPGTSATLFDLASLTKPLVALTLARLERAGTVDSSRPLGALLPAVGSCAGARASLALLRAHRSGLEGHRELYLARADARQPEPRELLVRAASAVRPDCAGAPPPEGFAPRYSDLGYLLLGAALEEATGCALDALVEREIAAPLGLSRQAPRGPLLGSARQLSSWLGSRAAFVAQTAPTELVPWRGGLIRGLVHDENAWVLAADGMAGHAGAFGDVRALLALGVAVLQGLRGQRSEWLGRDDLAALVTRRPGGSLCAGFDRQSGPEPSSGRRFGPETFGHLGFTGTSLWIDPEHALVGVLLSNRVCPSREHWAIRAARPAAYDALFEAMMRG